MPRSRSDLAGLLTVMAEAHDLDGLEPFTPALLDRVSASLGCEFATYYELDLATGDVSSYVRSSHEEALATWDIPVRIPRVDLERHRRLRDWSRDGVGTWSDVFSRAVRRSTAIGRHEQRAMGHIDTAWLAFGDGRQRSCWVTLGQRRDFTHGQRAAFLGSRGHVLSLIRHVDTRRRLADALTAIDADGDGERIGVLLLAPSSAVERASPEAKRIVRRWFGRSWSELPDELADFASSYPREPLQIERRGMRLVVERPTRGALVLREERAASAVLTAREREVMRCVSEGMSTAQIAQALWVTPGTVSKHLEHVYRKLGVTGRTAALRALRSSRTESADESRA